MFFAVKRLKKDFTERQLLRFEDEFKVLQGIKFPYIVEVYRYDNSEDIPYYVMEFCDDTLFNYIQANNTKIQFYSRKKIALQFLYAVNFLSTKNLLHRDLSYNNVLIKKYDNGVVVAKISDLGLYKDLDLKRTLSNSDIKGTIIDPCLEKFKDFNILNEIYSVGFILNFIFTGKTTIEKLYKVDSVFNSIIKKCVDQDIQKRYTNLPDIIKEIESLEDKNI